MTAAPQQPAIASEPLPQNVDTVVDREAFFDAQEAHNEKMGNHVHSIKLAPIVDNNAATPSNEERAFRTLQANGVIKLGRSDQSYVDAKPILYKSKVVSRLHAEIVLLDGKWYVRDVGSSSGTYVNNERIDYTGDEEGDKVALHSGDVLRLGTDFKGGMLPQYRAVRLYVLVDNGADIGQSQFLNSRLDTFRAAAQDGTEDKEKCALCLDLMVSSDGLFMSPCGHIWHFRCIQESLARSYPYFTCLLCRKACFLDDADEEPAPVAT